MNHIAESILMHYGTKKHSGRYPWGSGDAPFQRSGDFLSRIEKLKKQGLSETQIATALGMSSTTNLRAYKSKAIMERDAVTLSRINSLKADGLNYTEISKKMGMPESTVRTKYQNQDMAKIQLANTTAKLLMDRVNEVGIIDVGTGTEFYLNVSKTKLKEALIIAEAEGYTIHGRSVPQATNPELTTTLKLLCPPGTKLSAVYNEEIHSIEDFRIGEDANGNDIIRKAFVYPTSIDSSRVAIRYGEEGGSNKDGVVEIRRGVEDLSLGESHYAQVRILVDGKKYIKGMALYSDNVPEGYDILFNTNKNVGTPKDKIFKNISEDPDNPFGALIKEKGGQSYYFDKDGKEHLSAINKAREEGDWKEWSNSLPSQFLAKQPMQLINRQLKQSIDDKTNDLKEILALENSEVKKNLLKSYADECDYMSVHLQAAALPRQRYHVILPINSLKDNEVYAPTYKNGETLALIRYPHGGTFEIPIVKVNNKLEEGIKVLGKLPSDAIGINSKVADRLSGADFDGDSVMCIPCNSSTSSVRIASTPKLKALEGFDPKMEYANRPGIPLMRYEKYDKKTEKTRIIDNTEIEMGKITNLITDMTLKGADEAEVSRAVKHSMVVIDAGKHELDYKRSEKENGILALKKTYQGHIDDNDGNYKTGASTLLSLAKNEVRVTKRKGNPNIDPETGEVSYTKAFTPSQKIKEIKEIYIDPKTGEERARTSTSTRMAETRDAHTLSSGTVQENAYAEYANTLKGLSNLARKEMVNTKPIKQNKEAKELYKDEISSLNSKLNIALKNSPKERMAQIAANNIVSSKKISNPDMTKKELKKAGQMAITKTRTIFGASRSLIDITPKEWEAIQAGGISSTKLENILRFSNIDKVKQYAMPKKTTILSVAKEAKINSMKANGYNLSEIAEAVGVSTSTISNFIKEKE